MSPFNIYIIYNYYNAWHLDDSVSRRVISPQQRSSSCKVYAVYGGSVAGDIRKHLVTVHNVFKRPDSVYLRYAHGSVLMDTAPITILLRGIMCYDLRFYIQTKSVTLKSYWYNHFTYICFIHMICMWTFIDWTLRLCLTVGILIVCMLHK